MTPFPAESTILLGACNSNFMEPNGTGIGKKILNTEISSFVSKGYSHFHPLVPRPEHGVEWGDSIIYWSLIYRPIIALSSADAIAEPLLRHLLLDDGTCGKASEFHKHKTIAALVSL